MLCRKLITVTPFPMTLCDATLQACNVLLKYLLCHIWALRRIQLLLNEDKINTVHFTPTQVFFHPLNLMRRSNSC
jgi:hypothetical protein